MYLLDLILYLSSISALHERVNTLDNPVGSEDGGRDLCGMFKCAPCFIGSEAGGAKLFRAAE